MRRIESVGSSSLLDREASTWGASSHPSGSLSGKIGGAAVLFTGLAVLLSAAARSPIPDIQSVEFQPHDSWVEGLAFSPDGRLGASASRDGSVSVWDVATRREAAYGIKGTGGFASVAFGPDGRTMAAAGFDGSLAIWDSGTGIEASRIKASPKSLRVVKFSPDGTTVAVGGDDRTIRIWNPRDHREAATLEGHSGTVTDLTFLPDGAAILSSGLDGRVILWDLRSGSPRKSFSEPCGRIWSIALAPDGRSYAAGCSKGITYREIDSGKSRSWPSDQGEITAVRFRSDGKSLVSTSLWGTLSLWNLAGNQLAIERKYDGQRNLVKALAVAPDGLTLLTGSGDATVRLWTLSPGN